jgi:tetratricopeptide (TPR) repeat protein
MWRSWISAPGVKNDIKNQTELEQLINQVLSIELEPQKPPVKPVPPAKPLSPIPPAEPAPLIEPNEKPIATEPPEEPKYTKAEPNLPSQPVATQTLQLVKQLVQHPDRVEYPFELAEVLSSNGNTLEAAAFYKEALKRKSTDEAWLASNKAWTLLQIANCLRYSDIAVAKQMYQQVVVECPDSLWTDLARTQYEIINWYETENPSALVSDQILQTAQAGPSNPTP